PHIHRHRNIIRLRETRHPRNLGILRIDRIDITGVAKLTEETEGTAAKLILLGGGADQCHRTRVKQALEVHRLFHFLIYAKSFPGLRKFSDGSNPQTGRFARTKAPSEGPRAYHPAANARDLRKIAPFDRNDNV